MAVMSKRKVDIKRFKKKIRKHWEITDNGPINWFLGFEIKQNRKNKTLAINQWAYIVNLTEKFRLTNAKPIHVPMDPNVTYSNQQSPTTPNQVACMRGVPYNEAIGGVLWPVVVLRPDIGYTVGILSQFIQNPGQTHWEALKWVISYLNTTKDLWLTFGGGSKLLIEGFCNVDWVGQKDQHSILGYLFFFGQGIVSWSSKKQHIIVLSSMELEYIAQTHATKEALWLRSFINEIWGPVRGHPLKLIPITKSDAPTPTFYIPPHHRQIQEESR